MPPAASLSMGAVCALSALFSIAVGCVSGPARELPVQQIKPAPVASTAPALVWELPVGFPEPYVPANNPMSAAKVRLGRHLFYDTRLSGNGHFSCASCHRQELAFTDGRGRAMGSTGELHPRGAMSLTNVAYSASYNWADPTLTLLEDQALGPLLNRDPIELGVAGREEEVLNRLRADAETVALFDAAFPGEPISLETVVRAIAAFERTLVSGNSPYDRYLFWDEPLAEGEMRGLKLFFSERLRCSHCHAGLNLSGPVRASNAAFEVGERVPAAVQRSDGGQRFKAPTLRNIAVTAPYMHDGRFSSLERVVRFYAAGGRPLGGASVLESELAGGFSLTDRELEDLVAFLGALTDRDFLGDPRFADPRGAG